MTLIGTLKGVVFVLALAYGSVTDIRQREIMNVVPAVILMAGLVYISPLTAVAGLLVVGLPFLVAAMLGDGMGGGDVKLMGACGFMLGPWGGIVQTVIGLTGAVLFAAIRAVVTGNKNIRKEDVPLCPFLAVGGIASYLLFVGG